MILFLFNFSEFYFIECQSLPDSDINYINIQSKINYKEMNLMEKKMKTKISYIKSNNKNKSDCENNQIQVFCEILEKYIDFLVNSCLNSELVILDQTLNKFYKERDEYNVKNIDNFLNKNINKKILGISDKKLDSTEINLKLDYLLGQNICYICLETVTIQTFNIRLPCGHIFHVFGCFLPTSPLMFQIKSSIKCHTCRSEVSNISCNSLISSPTGVYNDILKVLTTDYLLKLLDFYHMYIPGYKDNIICTSRIINDKHYYSVIVDISSNFLLLEELIVMYDLNERICDKLITLLLFPSKDLIFNKLRCKSNGEYDPDIHDLLLTIKFKEIHISINKLNLKENQKIRYKAFYSSINKGLEYYTDYLYNKPYDSYYCFFISLFSKDYEIIIKR